MAKNQENNQSESVENQNSNQSTNVTLTNEQLQQLLQANQSNNQNQNQNQGSGVIKKGLGKAKESIDTNTRGMEGSVFSIVRWTISFVAEMIDGLKEYIKMRQNERKNKEDE